MARYLEHDTSNIYEAAQHSCNGSIVLDGAVFWESDLLEAFYTKSLADRGIRSTTLLKAGPARHFLSQTEVEAPLNNAVELPHKHLRPSINT
jgi:hypothetical protein